GEALLDFVHRLILGIPVGNRKLRTLLELTTMDTATPRSARPTRIGRRAGIAEQNRGFWFLIGEIAAFSIPRSLLFLRRENSTELLASHVNALVCLRLISTTTRSSCRHDHEGREHTEPGAHHRRTSLFRPIRLTAGTNFAGRWRHAPRYGRARRNIVNRRQRTSPRARTARCNSVSRPAPKPLH